MSGKNSKVNKNMLELLNKLVEYASNEIGVDFESPLNDNEMSQDDLLKNFLKQDSIQKLFPKEISTKGKKEKDPAAPKRPKSSYILFCVDKREEVKKKNPSMSAKEITSKLAEMWNSYNDKQKKKYVDQASKDKERYQEEMNDYVPSEGFEKKDKKKQKRVPSGYILFCQDKREEVKTENPEMKATEITSELGRLWKELSQEEKDEYNQKSKDMNAELKSKKDEDEEEEKPKKGKKNNKSKKGKSEEEEELDDDE